MKIIRKFLFLQVLILNFSVCFGQSIDLSNFHHLREYQYSTGKYRKIILVTPTRTGSTLAYNILRYLFEDQNHLNTSGFENREHIVMKSHRFKVELDHIESGEMTIYFVTVRHPVDAIMSRFRLRKKEPTIKDVQMAIQEDLAIWKSIDDLIAKKQNVILLKFEDFCNNFDNIFNIIEKEFSIIIDDKDKILLKDVLCMDNVKKYITQFSSFREYNKENHFHGDHIDGGEWEDFDKEMLREMIKETLISFPYDSSSYTEYYGGQSKSQLCP